MNGVEQAVLLAAGRGTRLGELTRNVPKPLLSVGGEPMLHRILSALADGVVRKVFVVTGHMAEAIEAATGSGERWGIRVRYRRQVTLDGTARALSLAREDLGQAPFFVGWGDIAVEKSNYARVMAEGGREGGALAVNEVDDPSAGAAVYVDGSQLVTRIVEKPPRGTSRTRWNNAGLMVLPPAIWPFVSSLEPSARGEYDLPAAVGAFVAAGGRIRGVPIEGPWFDCGTPESLAAARVRFGP